jgi:hypothetical protein
MREDDMRKEKKIEEKKRSFIKDISWIFMNS